MTETTERTFDWRPSEDDRNALFPIRSLLPEAVERKTKLWAGPYDRIDQGREGACVGFGWTIEMMSSPIRVRPPGYKSIRTTPDVADQFAQGVFVEARRDWDEWAGEDYDGTSVLAGAKVLRSRGYMDAFRWAYSIDDVIDTLITTGPVVIGIPWLSSMYYTDANGLVTVSGREVGGHCICLTGYYKSFKGAETIRWRNSWGSDYGVNGDGFIRTADLKALLADGEACVPLIRRHGP